MTKTFGGRKVLDGVSLEVSPGESLVVLGKSGTGKSVLLTLVGCVRGYDTTGGAEGVGRSTTSAVVTGSLAVLISDFFLTKVLF